MQARLHRTNPHGHTAENCEHDAVLEVLVTMRADQMSQMLPDGRSYSGAGPHRVRIYANDISQLDRLVEAERHEVERAQARHAMLCAEWMSKGKGRDGGPRIAAEYPGSVSQVFQEQVRRDMLPVVDYKITAKLDTIPMQAERARVAAGAEAAALHSVHAPSAGVALADIERMIADRVAEQTGPAIARAISAERERVAATTAKAAK